MIFSLLLIFFLFAAGASAQQQQQPTSPLVTPRLQINIPGVSFSQPAQEAGYLNLPFLAEYIIGLSNYLVAIAGILAGIMLTIGGVQYLMAAGNKSAIDAALKRIKGALIGLALVLGSYLILFTINPELVRLRTLQIKRVERSELAYTDMSTTSVNTMIAGDGENTASAATSFQDCPITLNAAATKNSPREPRSVEFLEKIGSFLTGPTVRERVVQAAQAAAKCGVHFGACITTAETINGAAGVNGLGRQTSGLDTTQGRWLVSLNCRAKLLTLSGCAGAENINIPNCQPGQKCAAAARAMAIQKFRTEIPGWPDSFVNQLEPGDVFWVYYANNALAGQHTAIFMGWEGNKAKVVQGAYQQLVNEGSICIKNGCGANIYPVTRIFKIK